MPSDGSCCTFCFLGDTCVFHVTLSCFKSGSKKWTRLSSHVMTCLKNLGFATFSDSHSRQTSTRRSNCSIVNKCRTHEEHTHHMSKCSVSIRWMELFDQFTWAASRQTDACLSLRMITPKVYRKTRCAHLYVNNQGHLHDDVTRYNIENDWELGFNEMKNTDYMEKKVK